MYAYVYMYFHTRSAELTTQKDVQLRVYDTSTSNVGADIVLQLKEAIKKRLELRRYVFNDASVIIMYIT